MTDTEAINQWREDWAFSTREERMTMIEAGSVPDYVLLYLALNEPPSNLIDLADPSLEERMMRACSIGQKLAILRMLTLALEDQSRAEKAALNTADHLRTKRSVTERLATYLSGR